MKRRWISSPRASSANCAFTTAPCTASVISMKRTGRWKATTGTPARAQPATTGGGTSRQLEPSSTASAASALVDQRRRPARLVSGVGAGAEPGRQHQFAALKEIVRLRHLNDVRPADLAPELGVADHDLGQRAAHHGQFEDVGKAQHDDLSCIMAEDPTDCPLRAQCTPGRVGNGQTEGVRVAATQAEADIHLEGVSKRFADMTAVDDLTLSIPRGNFFAMLGPSGCGKTTTLRMIGGFEDPTAGRVFLGGSDVTNHPPYKRDVNTVFQSYALFPHLTVEKNVAFGLERKKVGKAEATKRAERRARARPARPPGQAQARPALRRPAAARRARPRARQPAPRAAARRAARRARPPAAQAAPDRAQADSAGRRHYLRARDARPGRGHDHGRHDRGDERRQDRAGGLGDRPLRAPADGVRGQLPRDLEPDRREGGRHASTSRPTTARSSTSRRASRPRARSASACGRRRSRSCRPASRCPTGRTCCKGTIVVAAFLGVSIQYVIKAAGGEELNVFAQNTDGAEPEALAVGREVQLTWKPEHTFVVERG